MFSLSFNPSVAPVQPPVALTRQDNSEKILDDPTDKITQFIQGLIKHRKGIQIKADELNQEINFSNLRNLSNFQWKDLKIDAITPMKILKTSQVDAELRRICNSIFKKRKRSDDGYASPEQKFIYKKRYWDHPELNEKIALAVSIVCEQFDKISQQAFLAEFCAGASGVDDQCGSESHSQVNLTVDGVIMGLFDNETQNDLEMLIKKEVNACMYRVAQKMFSEISEEEENREDFHAYLNAVKKGEYLPKPKIVANSIMWEIQTQGLLNPVKWRKMLEDAFSNEEFLTSSKSRLGQTLALEFQDCFQMSIKSILHVMESLDIIEVDNDSQPSHNHLDCLELLALAKKLPEKFVSDRSIMDKPTMHFAIEQHFDSVQAILWGLKQIKKYGNKDLINLLSDIFKGTNMMELLDEAVAENLTHEI